jgi:hypothetical protein
MEHKSCFAIVLLLTSLAYPACMLTTRGQRYQDFSVPTPLPDESTLVLGFVGGREDWNNDKEGVRQLALRLRSLNLPGFHVETIENKRRYLAQVLIQNSFDRNRNGKLDVSELESARVVLYGQSFGGAAVVKLARELEKLSIPVLLTVQIDSVGRKDAIIPPNVRQAANLYQRTGKIIHGEPQIRAEDSSKTEILGNFQFDYRKKEIDLSGIPWWKKIFRKDHTKMNLDPDVWNLVEKMIIDASHIH